jgi:hypothetical protein
MAKLKGNTHIQAIQLNGWSMSVTQTLHTRAKRAGPALNLEAIMSSKSNAIVSSHRDAATRVFSYLHIHHGIKLSPINALEVVARVLGAADWQTLKAMAEQGRTPRMSDAAAVYDKTASKAAPAAEMPVPFSLPLSSTDRGEEAFAVGRTQQPMAGFAAALADVQSAMGLVLTPLQEEALTAIFQHKQCAIAGDRGTGKATILRALRPLAEKLGITAVYSARADYIPTGADLAKLNQCELLILSEDVIANRLLHEFLVGQAPASCRVVFFGEVRTSARGPVHQVRMVEKFRQERSVSAPIVRISRLSPPAPLMLGEGASLSSKYDRLNPPAEEYVMHGVFDNGAIPPTQSHHVNSYIYEAHGFRTSDRTGKWCIVRDAASVDALWAKIQAAVVAGVLPAAMVSAPASAKLFGGTYLICVFTPQWRDHDDVMRVRQLLRDLGVAEELGYKRDVETVYGVYGTADEWFYRA